MGQLPPKRDPIGTSVGLVNFTNRCGIALNLSLPIYNTKSTKASAYA